MAHSGKLKLSGGSGGRGGRNNKPAQYYVWYLGWKESRGLGGREYTEPIVKDMVMRRRGEELPKLTLEVSPKEIRIFQLTKGKWGRAEKIKFPTIPGKDVTYATQGLPPDEDVVACIYLGFNPTTRQAVHVHVYRCDSPQTAYLLVEHLTEIIKLPEHAGRIREIETELVAWGQVVPRPKNFISTYDGMSTSTRTPSTTGSDTIQNYSDDEEDRDSGNPQSPMDPRRYRVVMDDEEMDPTKAAKINSLASELQKKLGIGKMESAGGPILLPPMDYDTVHRKQGDFLKDYAERKARSKEIVGDSGLYGSHERRADSDSGSGDKAPTLANFTDGRDEQRPQKEEEVYMVSPRWKKEEVYNPPRRPRSPSPGPQRGVSPRGRRAVSPMSPRGDNRRHSPSPERYPHRQQSPEARGRQGRAQDRVYGRGTSPHPAMVGYDPRGRSPHPVFGDDMRGRSMTPERYPYQQPQRRPQGRSSSQGRYFDEGVRYNPGGSELGARSVYPDANYYGRVSRPYDTSDFGYYEEGSLLRSDEGYRSMDKYLHNERPARNKKAEKEKKKKRKSKGDEFVTTGYYVNQNPSGRSSSFRFP